MTDEPESQELLLPPPAGLEWLGDPRGMYKWPDGVPDYVALLGLGPEHVPGLIQCALKWADLAGWDDEDDSRWAPVHAWRALGQLRALEAVEPLLSIVNTLNERSDDWVLDEFPDVFAMIGPAAGPAVVAYLADPANREFSRVCAADGLCRIAQRHPEARDLMVAHLTDELTKYEENDYDLNAFLVHYLVDLEAVESAEVIERAYAAERVAEHIRGTWYEIRSELGVPGLGLAPDEPPRPPRDFRPLPEPHEPSPSEQLQRDRRKQQEKHAKAKHKQQQKARKRNRKRKGR